MVDTQTLTDFSLRVVNLTVNLVCTEIDKTCREISEKHFKLQLFAYL